MITFEKLREICLANPGTHLRLGDDYTLFTYEDESETVNFEVGYVALLQVRFHKALAEIYRTDEGYTPKNACFSVTLDEGIEILLDLEILPPDYFAQVNRIR